MNNCSLENIFILMYEQLYFKKYISIDIGLGDVLISTHGEGSQGENHGHVDVVRHAHILHDDGETGL